MTFTPEDQLHLRAASGYIALGMNLDANAELEKIIPEHRHLPQVLVFRLQIYHALEKWELMQTVAKRLATTEPENPQWWASWASATRRADSIDAARLILVNGLERHPASAVILYNLASYLCQLGNLEESKAKLKLAFELDDSLRLQAMEDEDLEPVWAAV
ncbi:MAG: hypothetical protein ABMA13_00700 [Chthoniobacteraceae bacterium]